MFSDMNISFTAYTKLDQEPSQTNVSMISEVFMDTKLGLMYINRKVTILYQLAG